MADSQDNPNPAETEQELMESHRAEIVDDFPQETPGGESSEKESDGEGKKYAGVYKTVEALEEGYRNLQAELTRRAQADKQQQQPPAKPTKKGESSNADDIRAQELSELRTRMENMEVERGWGELEREYGSDIRKNVREYFDGLPETDQQQLNTLAGARLIAQILRDRDTSKGRQSAGAPRSHTAKRSTLTEAQILRMNPDEYRARQGEIMEFYRQQAE